MADTSGLLVFEGPFLAKTGTLQIELPDQLKTRYGLYLWAVDFDCGFLVNYVGKTIRPFPKRFSDHEKWYSSGKDVCDPELMRKGENWLVESPTQQQILDLYACYRVFVASLDVDDDTLHRFESGVIQKLLNAGGKPAEFLGNKQKTPRKLFGSRVSIQSPVLIHGLGDYIEI